MTKKGVTIQIDEQSYDSDMALSPPQESTPLLRTTQTTSFRRQRSSVRSFVSHTRDFASPIEALAPLTPRGIEPYEDRTYVPFREASLVKSVPAVHPYRRKQRHRSFKLFWLNVSGMMMYLLTHCLTLILHAPYILSLLFYTKSLHRNFVTGGNPPVS